jgi:hypothetical protein
MESTYEKFLNNSKLSITEFKIIFDIIKKNYDDELNNIKNNDENNLYQELEFSNSNNKSFVDTLIGTVENSDENLTKYANLKFKKCNKIKKSNLSFSDSISSSSNTPLIYSSESHQDSNKFKKTSNKNKVCIKLNSSSRYDLCININKTNTVDIQFFTPLDI